MAKLVKYILIPIFFVFVMSHNVSAATTTYNLNDYTTVHFYPQVKIACQFTDNSNNQISYPTNVDVCHSPIPTTPITKLRRFYSYNTYEVQSNDIVEFYVVAASNSYTDGIGMFMNSVSAGSNLYYIMDVQQVAHEDFPLQSSIGANMYYSVYRFTFKVISSGTWNFGLILPGDYFSFIGSVDFSMYNISVFRPKGESQINKEQREAAEDAAADSQTSGSSSQNDATSATSSLISVITSGIGAITSASASNCVINADMGNFNMGSIDLCANPVPTFMQVIGSIIAALVVLPLVIVLFNRFIAIIGSFQR